MKHVAFFFCCLLWIGLMACEPTDPLDRKYSKTEGIKALIDDSGQPIIDSIQITYIVAAEVENEVKDRSNEQYTYRELMLQGREIVNQRRYELYDKQK